MRLLRLDEAELRHTDAVFRSSPVPGFLTALVLGGFGAGLLLAAAADALPWIAATLFGIPSLLISWPFAVSAYRATLPTGWTVAVGTDRVLVKLRSHLNLHFPADDAQVVELRADEIESVRRAEVRTTTPGSEGGRSTSRQVSLEIRVRGVDLAPLRERLAHERGLKTGGTAWRHYPVSVVGDDVVRVEWSGSQTRVRPGIGRVLDALAGVARVEEATRTTLDLARPGPMPRAELEQQLRLLAENGQTVAAVALARKRLGLGLADAKKLVDGLTPGE